MPLAERLSEYVRARFTGVWIQSHEHNEALAEIAQLCRAESWQLLSWDIEGGLKPAGHDRSETVGGDPLSAIRTLSTMATSDGAAILVLENFHRFLQSAEIVQALIRQVLAGKQNRTFIVILSPVINLPTELEKLFVCMEYDLPSRDQLLEIAKGIAVEEGELPEGADLDRILDAAAGLTRYEAENAYSLSLVRSGQLSADAVWDIKTQTLKKSGLLELYQGSEDFSTLGGLTALKAFCKRSLLHPSRNNPRKQARGVMLLSPPGCGKSQFCKCLGRETGRPVLMLDVGSLLGSLVGQTEERTRQAIRTIEAMAPCVVMVDEVEKAFAGLAGSGQTDSGVSARMFGSFLSWLNDKTSDVYVVCTANDVSKLPPEFTRSGRFDAIFLLDLPARAEKNAIWELYLEYYEIDHQQRKPDDAQFTGAEIKSCCRLAALLDLPLMQAAQNVVPVAVTATESVGRLRNWASGRCLSANQPGIYQHRLTKGNSRRRVSRDPSQN